MPVSVTPIPSLAEKDKERFHKRAKKTGPVIRQEIGECWTWSGAKNRAGYGTIKISGHSLLAHRISWTLEKGEIPPALFVLHKCDNPSCVRVDHLFLGTYKDNAQDKVSKGRCNAATGEKHGSKTHPECVLNGEKHPAKLHPERMARGDRNGARLYPERMTRGEKHWAVTNPEKLMRGEKQHLAKLTAEIVREMRKIRNEGMTLKAIADRYSVTKGCVHWVIMRKTWKHVV